MWCGLCPGERVRARELWAFLLRGGGREGGSLEWCAGAYFYISKTTVAVDPLRLQSIYCTHQCVGLSRVCARRGSAWQHRGAQGLSRRSGSAWTPPFAQGCALGKPPCHTSVCTQHQVARSQAQEGAPLLAGCARLTLPWGQHARVCDGSIVRVDFHPRRGLRRLGHVTMSRECDCERSCGLVMLHRVLLLARRRRWGVSARGAVFAFPGTRGFGRSRRPAGKLTTRRKRTVSFIGCSSPPRHRSGAEGEFRSCESGTRGPGLMTP